MFVLCCMPGMTEEEVSSEPERSISPLDRNVATFASINTNNTNNLALKCSHMSKHQQDHCSEQAYID